MRNVICISFDFAILQGQVAVRLPWLPVVYENEKKGTSKVI